MSFSYVNSDGTPLVANTNTGALPSGSDGSAELDPTILSQASAVQLEGLKLLAAVQPLITTDGVHLADTKVNGVSLAGLGTGLLKNTAGVPSIATGADLPNATPNTSGAMTGDEHAAFSIGTQATGTIQCVAAASISEGHTENVNGTAFTYKTTPVGATDVNRVGPSAQDIALALAAKINATPACGATAGTPISGLLPLTSIAYGHNQNRALTGTAASVRIGMLNGRNPLATSQGLRLLQKLVVTEEILGFSFKINPSALSHMVLTAVGPFTPAYSGYLATDGTAGADDKCEYWTSQSGAVVPSIVGSPVFDMGLYGTSGGEQFVIDMIYDGKSFWIAHSKSSIPTYGSVFSRDVFGRIKQGSSSLDVVRQYGAGGISPGAVLQLWGQ
jgi:hypothetical protein